MQLHSNIIGQGDPFLILHGFLGMGDNWKTLGKKYSELGYQVHMIDQRNHGRSPHSDAFSYQHLSDDLLEYCQTHQLKEVILLGHSMGGKTAMYFACEHPQFIKKLLIADIGPKYYAPHHQDILDSLLSLDFSEITSRSEAENILKNYIKDAGTRLFLLKNLYRKTKTSFGLRINLEVLNKNVNEIGKPLQTNQTFNGDTIFLYGENSNYILIEDIDLIKTHFPKAQLQKISKSGHWLHAENPAEFFNYSSKFIKNP
ncbi:alpha/beta fold hydrolase [Aquimarina agarivorans]|uniref:alpha/beta fold hydrolase n=1 Tax=Aquimarina agarivorans TaxID=980584 RepID=UPI000248E9BC|nr:alpha/beta fold hydrolase [Aquimarina agarivorans]